MTEIIMNLKSLAIKNHSSDNEPKTAYIECEGKGVVTAADIQADQDIEIMNPDQVIATLNGGKDCRLAMELTITKGRGYISADKGKTDDMPIGNDRSGCDLHTGRQSQHDRREIHELVRVT